MSEKPFSWGFNPPLFSSVNEYRKEMDRARGFNRFLYLANFGLFTMISIALRVMLYPLFKLSEIRNHLQSMVD